MKTPDVAQKVDSVEETPEEKPDSTETEEEIYQRLYAHDPENVARKVASMKTLEDIDAILVDLKIVRLVIVCGGTLEERGDRMRRQLCTCRWTITVKTDTEIASWMFYNSLAPIEIEWDSIREITKLGTKLGHPNAYLITLPDSTETAL